MTDTQRTDMLGCYGGPLSTPQLDAFAASAVRYDRAYTTQPVCGPARSALFTGYFPHSNGAWGNGMALQEHAVTIGSRLERIGLHTGYVGKWHLDGFDYFGLGSCPPGWDPAYWYDMRNYLEDLSPEDRARSRDPATNRTGVPAEFTFANRVTELARAFIRNHSAEDFFLVVSYDEPHHPYLCPEPFASMYRNFRFPRKPNVLDTLEDKPEHQRVWAGKRRETDRTTVEIRNDDFFGCNSFVDNEIGRVIGAIDEFVPDALVVYTSDHGDMLESHCLDGKGPAAYEEIARIPLIIRSPDAAKGAVSAGLVSHIDIVPTILTHFDVAVPKMLEGRPLQPQIAAPDTAVNEEVFVEFGRYEIDHDGFGGFQPMRSIVRGSYKLVLNLTSGDEFYDLEGDPGESVNLIESADHAGPRDELHDRLLDWMNRTRDPFRGYQWERREWRADAPAARWGNVGMTRQREDEDLPRQLDYANGLDMTDAVRPK
ncbi:MAG TPA: sulfatase-like hydrolase/transferase [Spirochaetia bacterium]|nr:sulfatase-like hydrolase/transferase [Spirochaetia bacterium]